MKNVELYYNDDRSAYAVLISPGWGSGWYTSNPEYPEIAYDKRVVEWFLIHDKDYFNQISKSGFIGFDTKEYHDARDFFDELGYTEMYFGGANNLVVKWVPIESIWRIDEYDGSEHIEFFDLKESIFMIEEGLHYLNTISRATTIIATTQVIIAILMLLFYLIYLIKK